MNMAMDVVEDEEFPGGCSGHEVHGGIATTMNGGFVSSRYSSGKNFFVPLGQINHGLPQTTCPPPYSNT